MKFKIKDILMYIGPKKKFLRKKESDAFIVTYKGQGEIDEEIELKPKTIIQIKDRVGGVICVKSVYPSHSNKNYFLSHGYKIDEYFIKLTKEQIDVLSQKLREIKLTRIVNGEE